MWVAFLPGSKDLAKVVVATETPKLSAKGKGPLAGKDGTTPHNPEECLINCFKSDKLELTVHQDLEYCPVGNLF